MSFYNSNLLVTEVACWVFFPDVTINGLSPHPQVTIAEIQIPAASTASFKQFLAISQTLEQRLVTICPYVSEFALKNIA
jgi:hypothetical protein